MAGAWVPPVALTMFRRWSGRSLRFSGFPADWERATQMSTGYDAVRILEKVAAATRAVNAGEASFERDSMLFDEPQYSFPILAALLRAASLGADPLEVVDFGGSLGSTYRQCKPFLDGVSLRWYVIEQTSFVDKGRDEFATDELKFFGSVSEVPQLGEHAVILAASVLQYLEDPTATMDELSELPARHLIIDRTPLGNQEQHRLCIQYVPAQIYEASYPCWILSKSRFLSRLSATWRLVAEYPCPEGHSSTDEGLPFEFRGLILERTA